MWPLDELPDFRRVRQLIRHVRIIGRTCEGQGDGGRDTRSDRLRELGQHIAADDRNECRSEIRANGERVRAVFYSGSTSPLFFGRNHAKALGFDPEKLSFSGSYSAANGTGKYAAV